MILAHLIMFMCAKSAFPLSSYSKYTKCCDVPQVNFIEDGQRSDDLDRGEPGRLRGARKPTTTFKGTLLHIR